MHLETYAEYPGKKFGKHPHPATCFGDVKATTKNSLNSLIGEPDEIHLENIIGKIYTMKALLVIRKGM